MLVTCHSSLVTCHFSFAGIRLGILLELLAISARCLIYATQPFPAKLLVLITLGGFIEMIGTGVIVGAIYKPRNSA